MQLFSCSPCCRPDPREKERLVTTSRPTDSMRKDRHEFTRVHWGDRANVQWNGWTEPYRKELHYGKRSADETAGWELWVEQAKGDRLIKHKLVWEEEENVAQIYLATFNAGNADDKSKEYRVSVVIETQLRDETMEANDTRWDDN